MPKTNGSPKSHPSLKDPRRPMSVSGRIHGTGHHLTEAEHAEMLALRKKNPETFTLRRLAAIYGLDPGSVFYALNGGRNKAKAKSQRRKNGRKNGKKS